MKAKQLAEALLDSPAARDDRLSSPDAWICMLPLLEEPYVEVQREWPGIVDSNPVLSRLPTLRILVERALVRGWRRWRDLAALWIAQGFPLDVELAASVRQVSKDREISQSARHAAFAAVVHWERAGKGGTEPRATGHE